MSSLTRRALLTALGTAASGALAGCPSLGSDDPPAGSLQFVNDDDLPHLFGFRVNGVGTRPGDRPGTVEGDPVVPPAQRTMTATDVVRPGGTRTYRGVFTRRAWYAVEFTTDGRQPDDGPETTVYNPAPPDSDRGRFLGCAVYPSGEFEAFVGGTDDPGPFTPGGTG